MLIKFSLRNGKHSEFGNSIVVRSDEISSIVQGKPEPEGWDRRNVSYGVLFLKGNPNPFYLVDTYEEALISWVKAVGSTKDHNIGLP